MRNGFLDEISAMGMLLEDMDHHWIAPHLYHIGFTRIGNWDISITQNRWRQVLAIGIVQVPSIGNWNNLKDKNRNAKH